MQLIIHRGSREIGGSCVEIATVNTRILIDFGMPLVDESGKEFNFNQYKEHSLSKLIEEKVLPDINGLYGNENLIDGILISHPHQDHFGLLNYVNTNIPVYLSEGTKRLILVTYFFSGKDHSLDNEKIIKPGKSFAIGDIRITPYLVDHSGFDAMAFFIEAGGGRAFYSGDFRGHGRKKSLFDNIIKNPPDNIDYLILEGTCIEKDNALIKSETDIEIELEEAFENNKLTFISYSSQNIDRIVSLYKASVSSKKILVVDPYTAYVLNKIKDLGKIPQPEWNENFRIFFVNDSHTLRMANNKDLYKFKNKKITEEEIKENKNNIVIRNSFYIRKKFEYLIDEDTQLIYSQWIGYFSKEKEFWDKHGINPTYIHSSGHAPQSDLVNFADALNPKHIIPIHTFAPEKFKELFGEKVIML